MEKEDKERNTISKILKKKKVTSEDKNVWINRNLDQAEN